MVKLHYILLQNGSQMQENKPFYTTLSFELDLDEFKSLYKQAGFKNKNELAKFLDLSHTTINMWGSVTPFPRYIKPLLVCMIQAQENLKSF